MALSKVLTKVALQLIKKFGRSATLQTTVSGEYNPDTGNSSITTESTISLFSSNYKTTDYKDGLINMGDVPIYTTSQVKKSDIITMGNIDYSVIFVESYFVNDQTVLYYANIRTLGA